MKVLMRAFNRVRLLANMKGKKVRGTLLEFQDGTKHVLLPNGQHVRQHPKDRSRPGKSLRRERIKFRRQQRALNAKVETGGAA